MKKIRRQTLIFILLSTLWGINISGQALACNDSVVASLDSDGNLTIYPEDILEGGPYDYSVMQVFNQETGEGGDFLSLDCDDIGTFTIEVVASDTGNSCWGSFTVEDKLKPIPYVVSNSLVSMNGGNSVTVPPSVVDIGSYDNCSIVDMTLSPSTFTASGEYVSTLTITDQSGNSNFATVLITVVDGIPSCIEVISISLGFDGQAIISGSSFVEGNEDYDVLEVSLDNTNFGETVAFNCDDIGAPVTVYVHIEQDGNEYNCTSEATLEDKLPPIAIVNDFTIDLDSETDTYTLLVSDIDNGSIDNCSGMTFSLSQSEFSSDDWGQNPVILTGTDVGGLTASATATVTVLIDGEAAPLQCVALSTAVASPWGTTELWGVDFVLNSDDFDQVLASLDPAGPFTDSFFADCGINNNSTYTVYIQATIDQEQYDCEVQLTVVDNIPPVAIADQTIILNLVDGMATLTAEMVDDGSYDNCTDIVFSLSQTLFTTTDIGINTVAMTVTDLNGNESIVFTTVIVDDGTGCNLAFVQFPDNIEIFDDNGTVDNLAIDNLQSIYGYTYEEVHPYTVNECEEIEYTFEDIVISFVFGMKVVRTWTVLDFLSGEVLTHIQELKLYTNLENLVTVSTGTNRAMPGVIINNTLVTNMEGVVYVENDPINSIQYEDSKLNGLNVLDLVLIRKRVLGAIEFDESSTLAADITLNNGISTLDVVLLQRFILGHEEDDYEFAWRFYDKVVDNPLMKGAYLGIKPGDVDDSALLEGDDPLEPVANFEVNDILLNAGEMYSVPIYLEKQYTAHGIEFRANIDNDLIDISNITSGFSSQYSQYQYHVTEEGILTVLWSSDTVEEFGGDLSTPVFNIEFEAKENSSLSLALDMDSHLGYVASSSLDLIVLGGKIINAGIYPSSFICDTLPRTADVGDCESGHTLDDDVEWPADLSIADYRISPANLIEYSGVDVLDSEPSFYNEVAEYSASYVDLLGELNNTTLVIGRVWTVVHATYGFTWTYNQSITVDFTGFENLVTINTGTDRAMPGVIINDAFFTNIQGDAYVDGQPVNSITYEDDYLNGINILDLIIGQRHILGLEILPEYGIIAADINNDQQIKASDLFELRKNILGITPKDKGEWKFYIKEIESPISVMPKGVFVGVKLGDVDDSVLLQEEDPIEPESKFEVLDILLNKGESYSIPVYIDEKIDAYGIDFRAIIDNNLINVIEVQSDYSNVVNNYHVSEEGLINLIFSSPNEIFEFGGGVSNPVFTIEIEARENSLLSLALDLDSRQSYVVSSDLELIVMGGEIDNMIGTGTNSEELSSLSVYPNPTSDYLNIDLRNVSIAEPLEISIYEMNGQKLFTRYNSQTISISELTSGMYYYQIKIGEYTTTGKFIVVQ